MRLETLAWRRADERVRAGGSTSSRARGTEEELLRVPVYSFSPGETVETAAMIREIVEDIQRGTAPAEIALRFHRSVAEIIVSVANRIRDGRKTWAAGNASTECEEPAAEKDSPAAGNGRKRGRLDTLVLSGGVFQNRLLLEMGFRLLEREGFRVFANREVPANDGGIALGQIAVAGARAAGERLRDRRAMDSRELGEGERKHRRGGVYVSGHSG
jgi:tRNA A37 threonylcarbamoyltransferase TsaD